MPRVAPGYKEDVRRRIMRAALEEVNACGLQALRMEDVAARVGISRAALYNYFSDKEALLGAIIHEMQEEGMSVLEDTFQEKSFKDALSFIFELMVLSAQEMPGVEAELFSIASRTPKIQCLMHSTFEDGLLKLSGLIEEGQKGGEIVSAGDPRCLAEIVMYTLGGLKHAIIFGSDTAVLKTRWNAMTELLFFTEEKPGD
ncbi:TetR/AcrR family transcriptional regulator [Methanogenium sp. S4BF]|uniref:TetR/AcrR family transcriptional regulator n=1 Tax=Methanogenium sp. S4BF TaxID=1789226 RepID=UPI002416B824|nr:TetR/AcrR family transcriptional regulator [Methanogenium sp. S4BF]WFN34256.1 TetR/AcrR family transcriptional regulator [Methanogenium sp. S4BF]